MDFAANTVACFKGRKCILKKQIELSDKSRDLLNVSILLMLALCLGIYLIVTTALISKDGVTFIKYGQQIEADPVKTMV